MPICATNGRGKQYASLESDSRTGIMRCTAVEPKHVSRGRIFTLFPQRGLRRILQEPSTGTALLPNDNQYASEQERETTNECPNV
jgi:hypothetical protein